MSYYSKELRAVVWPPGELTLAQVSALSLRVPGDYGNPLGTVVYEVGWLVALKVVQTFGGCQKGLRDLLNQSGQPRGGGWASTNVKSLVGNTPTGSQLRDYQLQAVQAMSEGQCILGDEQGLGKTICVLAAQHACLLRELRGLRMLVVIPSDEVADEWRRMTSEHFNKKCYVIKSPECITKRPVAMQESPIWIITYSKFWRPNYKQTMLDFLSAGDNLLVFDEAHRLSGYTSQQHEGSRELIAAAWRVWFTTGTWVTSGAETCWAMYSLATGSGIKREEWIRYLARGTVSPNKPLAQQAWDEEKLESLAKIFPTFGIRRLKSQVLKEIPPLIGPIEIEVDMDKDHAALYAQLKHTSGVELEGVDGQNLLEVDPDQYWTKALRLYQMSTHPALLGEVKVKPWAKFEALCNLIQEAGEQKIIVWGHFPEALNWLSEELERRFPTRSIALAHGGVSKAKRIAIKNNHQAGEVDILVANPMCWGEGITLTNASVAIWWDLHPSRVLWQQAKDRLHRWGQTLSVTCYWLMYRNTVQMSTMKSMKRKDRMASLIMGDSPLDKKAAKKEAADYVSAQQVRLMLMQASHKL